MSDTFFSIFVESLLPILSDLEDNRVILHSGIVYGIFEMYRVSYIN